MARQATNPIQFKKTTRKDDWAVMTSGRAGVVTPIAYAPILRGDSASGSTSIDVQLAEMPRPLLNGVMCNVQAWFVPKASLPRFAGYDDFIASYHGETIKALGQPDRLPAKMFEMYSAPGAASMVALEFSKTLGIHIPADTTINHDLVDSFVHVYNFRLAAHSDRLAKKPYAFENGAGANALPPAFWPSDWRSRMVPDYERALITGALDLDVTAGRIPIQGLAYKGGSDTAGNAPNFRDTETGVVYDDPDGLWGDVHVRIEDDNGVPVNYPRIIAEMEGQGITTSLADIDKARQLQSFAKMRAAYQGNDINAYVNDDVLVAELMQGFNVPEDHYKRPWLLDSKRVPFGFAERHATDAANLDQSVSTGRVQANLSINLPRQETGGMIIVTVEVLPERVDERQTDEFLLISSPSELPDALRDVQRIEPVDLVKNRRLDAKHTQPDGLYAYEPMNDVWNRNQMRLGGSFYQANPLAQNNEQRSGLWMAPVVDPVFSEDHYLAPSPFPHDVFADTLAPAFEVVCRQNLSIVGLTQFGDILAENSDDYAAITDQTV